MTNDTNTPPAESDLFVADDRTTSVFYTSERKGRVRVADNGIHLVVSMPLDETNNLWKQVELDPKEALQLALHILTKPTLIEEVGTLSIVRAAPTTDSVVDKADLEAVLREIVEVGTRRSVERVGDMYDMVNGYEDRVQVSDEARLAAEALGIEIEED